MREGESERVRGRKSEKGREEERKREKGERTRERETEREEERERGGGTSYGERTQCSHPNISDRFKRGKVCAKNSRRDTEVRLH